MIWSKSCENKSSHHRLHNQKHRVPAPFISKSKSQKKRKFDWYIYDDIFTINFELDGEENDSEYAKDERRCLSSPHSCSTLADKNKAILQRTKEHVFPTLDDKEYCGINIEDYSHLSESKDSINGSSYPMYQGSLTIQRRDLTGSSSSCSNSLISTKTPLKDTPRIDFVETLKDTTVGDFTDGKTSHLLNKTKEDIDLVCSVNKYLHARGHHLPRPVIPIGPMFQAEVPNWEGRIDIKQHNGDYGLKWLGTQIWPIPIPIIVETNTRDIQKGTLELYSLEDLNKSLH